MTTILFRTVLIYLLLMITMRLMGKRQIGQLELTDLVTTLLISEIASLPITDSNIPVLHAVIPILTLLIFEVTSSLLLCRFPGLKNLLSARPATLIRNGKLRPRAMLQARLSADELIGELRQQNITDPSEVLYAILEQNGKITVIPKIKYRTPTVSQMRIKAKETGLYHIVVDKGTINRHSLENLGLTRAGLIQKLERQGMRAEDIYLMMIDDAGNTQILKKDEVKAE